MTRPMATSSKSVKIPKPKRVLIVYATGGMGHVTAARAVAQAFAEQFPDVAVETCDILDFASRWYRLIFVHGYNYISAKLPKFWGWLYHHYNDQLKGLLLFQAILAYKKDQLNIQQFLSPTLQQSQFLK